MFGKIWSSCSLSLGRQRECAIDIASKEDLVHLSGLLQTHDGL